MAGTLANGIKNRKGVMDAPKVPGVLAVMATAGLYDDSGKWLYHTGLPAKSGVGRGLIVVSPGKSPPLDDAGNSARAEGDCRHLERARWESASADSVEGDQLIRDGSSTRAPLRGRRAQPDSVLSASDQAGARTRPLMPAWRRRIYCRCRER